MCPDEIYYDMNDNGFFVDMETNMFLFEEVDLHPHSDSDLVNVEKKNIGEAAIVDKTPSNKFASLQNMVFIHITYLVGVSFLCYKLWVK